MEYHRHSIRLNKYDYANNGWYFVTICSQNRKHIFGEIIGGEMKLNDAGLIVDQVWKSLPDHHQVVLDAFQIMPDHIHLIMVIVGARRDSPHNNFDNHNHEKLLRNQDIWLNDYGALLDNKCGLVKNYDVSLNNQGKSLHNRRISLNDYGALSHNQGASRRAPTDGHQTLGWIIGMFKTMCTKKINENNQTRGLSLFQRNYFERVIRNEKELKRIREYIRLNSQRWERE